MSSVMAGSWPAVRHDLAAGAQQEQVLDDDDEVLAAQRRVVEVGHAEPQALAHVAPRQQELVGQLLVELVAPHPRQVVALGVEEQLVEDLAGRVGARRLARAQQVVDAVERLLLRLRRVLAQRVADDVGLVLHRDDEHLEGLEAGLVQHLELLGGDLVVGLDQDLARGLVHDVLGAHPPERGLGLLALHLERLVLVEELEDLAVAHEAQRPQQHGDRQLALAVDVDVHDVVHVEAELHPRAAVRDDARRSTALCRSGA